MTLRTTYRRTRLGASALTAAAAALALALPAGDALAQAKGGVSDNVFMEARANGKKKPQLLFVFSDGSKKALTPRDAFTIELADNGACAFDFDAKPEMGDAAKQKAVYGPTSGQQTIDALKLPSFFSQLAANELLKKKLVGDKQNVVPYFNCTGLAWALLLSQEAKPGAAKKN